MRFLSLVLGILAAFAIAGPAPTVTYEHAHVAYVAPINEDSPGWICWSMGNRMCSRTPLDGPGDGAGIDTTAVYAPQAWT